jgi:hypothetical protein
MITSGPGGVPATQEVEIGGCSPRPTQAKGQDPWYCPRNLEKPGVIKPKNLRHNPRETFLQ